jgi:hypothetical protein
MLWNSTNHGFQSGLWLVESGVLLQWSFHRSLCGWPLQEEFQSKELESNFVYRSLH